MGTSGRVFLCNFIQSNRLQEWSGEGVGEEMRWLHQVIQDMPKNDKTNEFY